ncbi:jg7431 [Pararge aegeria aegeria]|uniref:Jg7431 protein n=1 Tax=Pararge aegeria aegeria TaxID=348720 RepID=A0A8S4S1F8_9NEOP|nr:jg7431 [Pararge aegeria aegeria]
MNTTILQRLVKNLEILKTIKKRNLQYFGVDKIEFLQSHENLDIYQKSFEIIENYFGSESEDGRVLPDVSSPTEFSFGASSAATGYNF